MNSLRQRIISLCHGPDNTWMKIYHTLKADPQLTQTFEIPQLNTMQSPTLKICSSLNDSKINKIMEQYTSNGIELITYFDDDYPEMLKEIYQPPWCLFVKGKKSLLKETKKLAIVGSRDASLYGKNAIRHIIAPLIKKNMVIVSGLATGVDTFAHEETIHNGGKTIAVIAGGFNHLYPKENLQLANLIAKEHLLISEYPPNSRPERWQFPARNRIISGLCEGTLVVEAKSKSGSLITANFAIQEGREVFAVPGYIFSTSSQGTNELIQQGAKLVMSGEDILSELRK